MSFVEPSKAKAKVHQRKKATKHAINKTVEPTVRISPPVVQLAFSIGDLVQHPMFGDGKIESIRDDKATVTFKAIGTKEIRDDFLSPKK